MTNRTTVAIFILVAAGLSDQLSGHAIDEATCPEVTTLMPFDAKRYMGTWYGMASTPVNFNNSLHHYGHLRCSSATYTLLESGEIEVKNCAIDDSVGKSSCIIGRAFAKNPKEPAKLSVLFPGSTREGHYWILDTDYETYTLVYSCQIKEGKRVDQAWVLGRERGTYLAGTVEAQKLKLAAYGVDVTRLSPDDQNCSL